MILFWIFLLIGIAGGWEQGLITTPAFLLLTAITFTLLVIATIKQNKLEKENKND